MRTHFLFQRKRQKWQSKVEKAVEFVDTWSPVAILKVVTACKGHPELGAGALSCVSHSCL